MRQINSVHENHAVNPNGSFDTFSLTDSPPAATSPSSDSAAFGPSPDNNSNPGRAVAGSPVTVPAESTTQASSQQSGSTSTSGSANGTSGILGGGNQSGLIINVNYDASCNSAPAAFKTDVAAVVAYFESQFTDPITITINVGYGEINGQTMGGGYLGESLYYLDSFSYSQIKNALTADAKSATDASAVASLAASDPTNGGTYWLSQANAKALGLASGTSTDGWVGFGSGVTWDYNTADGVTPGQYDFFDTVAHEITEVMGRELQVGGNISGTRAYSVADLFHYSAPRVRDLVGTQAGFFSIDGGATNLNSFNTNSGGDYGDWAGNTADAFNAFGSSGRVNPVSAADLTLLDAIGFNPAPSVTGPQVSSVTAIAGDYTAGNTLALTLNLSAAVNVTGSPTLTLNDGAIATYTGGTGTNALTFSYTVAAGQNTSGLAVTAVTGTIADTSGKALSTSNLPETFTGVIIDTVAPTVSSVTTSGTGIAAGAGDLASGSMVTLTINLSEAVTIAGGTPTLTLNDGGTASYVSGTGTNALTFSYTVGAGQNTADLAVTAVNLGTATVKDGAGNAANLIGAVINPAGTLQIDTTAPTVSSLVTSGTGITAGAGDLVSGSVVTLTLNLSEAVTVAGGTPSLTLNDGGTASYVSGTGSNALVFSYTVGAAQNTADLAVTAVNLGTATIKDGAGNAADLTGAVTNPAGTLQIDTTAPTVSSLVTSGTGITAGAGDFASGSVVTFTLNLSEAVTVAGGTPSLTLNDGGTASYVSGTGSNALTFSYTVAAGQNTADLAVTAVNLGTATVKDGAGNAANLTGAVTNPAGTLQIDTTAPTVSSLIASGTGITAGAGDLASGSVVTLTLNLSEAVTVAGGTPTLTLNDGGTASYVSGTGSNALVFSYTVAAGQNTSDLAVTAVNLGAATVKDGAGNAADLTGVVTNPAGTLQIDTTAPTVSSLVASGTGITAGAGDLASGSVVTLTLNLSEAVTVAGGTPSLTLNDGGTASYVSGTGTNALVFSYTVGAGQNTADLAVTAVNLGTATVKDAAGNAASLTGAVTNPAGTLQIDATAPTVSSLVASGAGITAGAGDLASGSVVTLTLNLSEAVTVAGGTPTLTLNDGGTASYVSGTGSNALVFSYTVAAGQNTADLAVTAVNLGTATVKDGAGNAANLTGAVTNPAGTLQIDTGPQIDTVAPTVTQVTTSPSTGEIITNQIVRITLDMSEAVIVNGSPRLWLNDGGSATFDAASSSANALVFDYVVQPRQMTTDLRVSGLFLPTGSSIHDLAGNNAILSGAGADLGLQVNTTTTGAAGPSSGSLYIPSSTTFDLFGASKTRVTFSGTPGTLKLDDSRDFAGSVSGLAGADALDLSDISYGSGTVASFAGNTSAGTLTITDGSNTAHIALLGNYTTSGWTLSSDGNGGTMVVDPPLSTGGNVSPMTNTLSLFTQHMASHGTDTGFGGGSGTPHSDPATQPTSAFASIATPRM